MTKIQNLDNLPERIKSIYSSVSKEEKKYLKQILIELSTTGSSPTYENIWLADFKEVPVSIDTFICDPYYLGSVNRNGEAVYPFWRETLRDIFNSGNKYNEIILSGATRIGKTSTAVIILAYMLYRLMLYRDPHSYFKKKQVSKFTIIFANLTKELAEGVAYREFNDTLKASPFFNDHGKFSRSDRKFYYIPEGDNIDIIAVSDASQALGMQAWCLKGDTKILTSAGIKTLEECQGTTQDVFQYSPEGRLICTSAEIRHTNTVRDTIRIELEDGTIIEGTPQHKVMLSNGTYKELQYITDSDDILTLNTNQEVDDMNLRNDDVSFLVYVHTSPNGKRYIGITSRTAQERWQSGGSGYKDNLHFWNAIQKYGWDNFEHIIVATGLSLQEASQLEMQLIAEYDTMNPEKGYNHTTGGNWSKPDIQTRKKLSRAVKKSRQNPEVMRKISEGLKGHPVSKETRHKISKANTGRKVSETELQRRRSYRHSEETLAKLKGRPSWSKGLTKEADERLKIQSEKLKGRKLTECWKQNVSEARKAQYASGYDPIWINDGHHETTIQRGSIIPEGFNVGRLSKLDTYVYKGDKSIKISSDKLDEYLSDGWVAGRPSSVGESIRKANQKMHWEYDDIRFDRAEDLAQYLRENTEYTNIVASTITALSKKGFDKSPKYKLLHGNVRCIIHED